MRDWSRFWIVSQLVLVAILIASPLWSGKDRSLAARSVVPGPAMRAFANPAELDAILAPFRRNDEESLASEAAPAAMDAAAAPMASIAIEEPPPPPADSITNVQTQGVDEGGIVKRSGDLLVVLRRGRLFTLSTADGGLRTIDRLNAYPGTLGDSSGGGGAWYDEMLVSGDLVVVIGYSYARQGTEISRFRLGRDGTLTYRDTHHIRSADYYSDRNYASRLIGNRLIIYSPLPTYGRTMADNLPAIAEWTGSSRTQRFEPYADHSDVHLADPYWTGKREGLETLHTVSTCDLTADDLDCEAQVVLGSWSRSFYVSANAVYIWTGAPDDEDGNRAMLYRMPLDGGAPQAIEVAGNPIDQFSFREDGDVLNVLTQSFGGGDAMWAAEESEGSSLALLRLPLSAFGSGNTAAEGASYRGLPALGGYGLQNRYVGQHLVYGAGEGGGDWSRAAAAYAVPLGGGEISRLDPRHRVTRIDQMGSDAILIGQGGDGALTFTTVRLDANPTIADRFRLPGAGEGENRSHAFFFRADPDSSDGASGLLGLPVSRTRTGNDGRFLGSSGSILFLRRAGRKLGNAGELATRASGDIDDNCHASCVDWYGNARPIFLGSRIFALMGYELVEGRMTGGRIGEVRRVDFTPRRIDRRRVAPQEKG